MDLIDVDFEWFDPDPNVDFHGLKTLLRQLFDVDNQLFDLSALTDLILAQPHLGSTVKCDGKESDPYSFLSVLNLHEHREKEVIKQLTKYILARAETMSDSPLLHQQLKKLLSSSNEKAQVGLILTERFINMPHETIPPMYTMLLDELAYAAREEKKPYPFTHYLIISKTYTEVASKLDAEDNPPSKKTKAKAGKGSDVFSYFHPEDEVLQKHAMGFGNFEYEKQGDEGASDAKRTFSEMGIRPQGHLVLIEGGKLKGAVEGVVKYLSAE